MSETPHGGPTHGGPDAGLEIRFDFSTNAHPLGANPRVRSAVEKCDRTRYPDPSYARLRALLGAFHNVVPQRIVVGASARCDADSQCCTQNQRATQHGNLRLPASSAGLDCGPRKRA